MGSTWLHSHTVIKCDATVGSWRFGIVVASFVAWTKLLYIEPG